MSFNARLVPLSFVYRTIMTDNRTFALHSRLQPQITTYHCHPFSACLFRFSSQIVIYNKGQTHHKKSRKKRLSDTLTFP